MVRGVQVPGNQGQPVERVAKEHGNERPGFQNGFQFAAQVTLKTFRTSNNITNTLYNKHMDVDYTSLLKSPSNPSVRLHTSNNITNTLYNKHMDVDYTSLLKSPSNPSVRLHTSNNITNTLYNKHMDVDYTSLLKSTSNPSVRLHVK